MTEHYDTQEDEQMSDRRYIDLRDVLAARYELPDGWLWKGPNGSDDDD